MAVKWAVASGNWNATATWNGGTIPVDGDVIYLNYRTLTINVDIFQPNSIITNDANPDYGIISGGEVRINRPSVTINFRNTESPTRYLLSSAGSQNNIHIIGDVDCMSFYSNSSGSRTLTVTGNVNIAAGGVFFSQTLVLQRITITGNLTLAGILQTTINTTTEVACAVPIYITGKFSITRAIVQFATEVNVTGVLFYNKRVNITGLHINGRLEYENTTTSILLRTNNLDILNPESFTWKDITEPRSNPFIILTDAEMNNLQQYPPENEVKVGTEYVWGQKVGTYQQPPESVVLKGYRYDNDEKEGTLENENIVGCVTPEDVRKDVPLVGMGVVGSLVVPSVDDVREGVIFDNGSVGTLIVQGGGDRLRIADFGYYTNAQSDTYIVDLTEQDKPKFAVAEERVLIEMFPDLDLENIPDKYFDDLFVKYLKYRLIVEYYRTAGINSTFTPSEPTTEIVNYQNVRNVVWLNSANIYLKSWARKYPESIVKPQRILL